MIRSIEYPKTENLFARNPVTHKLTMEFKRPEFRQINLWDVTEKIDGTNIRVIYKPVTSTWPDPPKVEVRGRSDRASVPRDLEAYLLDLLPPDKLAAQFDEFIGPERIADGASVTLFGEGYGAGIQKGGKYGPVKRFVLFDVMYHWPVEVSHDGGDVIRTWHDSWCQPSTTRMIGKELGIPLAPYIGRMTLGEINAYVRAQAPSKLCDGVPEGVVARTDPYLYTERGHRVMFKLKGEDLNG